MNNEISKWLCGECGFLINSKEEVKNCPNCMADEKDIYKLD